MKLIPTLLRRLPDFAGVGWLAERCARWTPQVNTQIEIREGPRLTVDPRDVDGRQLYFRGEFGRQVVDTLEEFARPGDTLLDIGANIGYVSVALLARVPGLHVIAVEPVWRTHQLLMRNLAPFGKAARCLRCALSNHEGTATMRIISGHSGGNRLATGGTETVPVTTIAGLGLNGTTVNLVKIDVEGHETTLLPAMLPWLETMRPRAVVFEHKGAWPCLRRDPILGLLLGRGWTVEGIYRHGVMRNVLHCHRPTDDFVAYR